MAQKSGSLLLLQVDGVTVACQQSGSFSTDMDMLETTCKQATDQAKSYLPGEYGATVSFEINYDPATGVGAGIYDFLQKYKDRNEISWRLGELTAGARYIEGSGFFQNLSIDGPRNEISTSSGEIMVNGPFTLGVNP